MDETVSAADIGAFGQLLGFGDSLQRYRNGSEDLEGIPYRPPT